MGRDPEVRLPAPRTPMSTPDRPKTTTDSGDPRAERRALADRRAGRPDRAARPLRRAEDAALQPRARARARRPRQGRRRARLLRGHQRRHAVHEGGVPVAGRQAHRHVRALLDGRRRAGLPGHRPRPARLRAEVLYRGRQLRHGRQQHAGLLRPRPVEVPGLHPLPEAPAGHRACAPTTCSGTSGRCRPRAPTRSRS